MIWLLAVVHLSVAKSHEVEDLLNQRYVPYADWSAYLSLDDLKVGETSRYWRTADEIAKQRVEGDLPLSGLRLALDPGHLGGNWAKWEGREFRINDADFWVREGDLVLKVALQVKEKLEARGAEVFLVRDSNEPVNPKGPMDYLSEVIEEMPLPSDLDWRSFRNHISAIRDRAIRRAIVSGELQARADLVNQVIRPDALVSLHIDAAVWPENADGSFELVSTNRSHVLVFGAVTPSEMGNDAQLDRLKVKLTNDSPHAEVELGRSLASALSMKIPIPAASYQGRNAVMPVQDEPYLWARNLKILRLVDCPTVMLEPFIANSAVGYRRLQDALAVRSADQSPPAEDILLTYAEAVVAGILDAYGSD